MTGGERERGASLVIVLWVTTVIAGLAIVFLRDTTTDQLRLRNIADEIRSEAIMDAALARTAMAISLPDQSWPAFEPKLWAYDQANVRIAVEPEAKMIDLNRAPPELLQVIFDEFDLDAEASEVLIERVMEWRGEELEEEGLGELNFFDDEQEGTDALDDENLEDAAAPTFLHSRELQALLEQEPAIHVDALDRFTVFTGKQQPELVLLDPKMRRAIEAADLPAPQSSAETDTDETNTANRSGLDGDEGTEDSFTGEDTDDIEGDEFASEDSDLDGDAEEPSDGQSEASTMDLETLMEQNPSLAELSAALGTNGIFRIDLDVRLSSGFRRGARIVLARNNNPNGPGYSVLDWQDRPAIFDKESP